MRFLLLDTNLLLFLRVGRADPSSIGMHKRTRAFDPIETLVAACDGMVTTAHVLTETSNLLRHVGPPVRETIQLTFHVFVERCGERPVASLDRCRHDACPALGLTDAVILVACGKAGRDGNTIDLMTADEPLYDRVVSLGLPAEFYPA